MDLLPERPTARGTWWSFASTGVLIAVGLPFIVGAIAWAADLVTSFMWVQLPAVLVLAAIGLFYLVAAGMSAEASRTPRQRRGAHAPRQRVYA